MPDFELDQGQLEKFHAYLAKRGIETDIHEFRSPLTMIDIPDQPLVVIGKRDQDRVVRRYLLMCSSYQARLLRRNGVVPSYGKIKGDIK